MWEIYRMKKWFREHNWQTPTVAFLIVAAIMFCLFMLAHDSSGASMTVPSGNADTLDNWHAASNGAANSIPVRTNNGDLYLGFSSAAEVTIYSGQTSFNSGGTNVLGSGYVSAPYPARVLVLAQCQAQKGATAGLTTITASLSSDSGSLTNVWPNCTAEGWGAAGNYVTPMLACMAWQNSGGANVKVTVQGWSYGSNSTLPNPCKVYLLRMK